MRKITKKKCLNCGEEFNFLAGSKKEREVRKFCSSRCNGLYYGQQAAERCRKTMLGRRPPNYKGGTITKSGSRNISYIDYYLKGKRVKKHRIIMEKHMGRKLRKNEVVHHIDGDGTNNSLSNLALMTVKEHLELHRGGGAL